MKLQDQMPYFSLTKIIVPLFGTSWTAACQALLSMDFSRQQRWSGLPFPSPRGSSWPRDQTRVSSIAGRFFTIWTTNRWGNNGNSERLYFLGSKITADGYCSHEIKTCPLSWWCHPINSSSVIPFSSCPQSFPASGCFLMSQFFTSGSQNIGVSASAFVLPMNIQDWFPLRWTGINSLVLSFLRSPTLTSIHDYWKNHSFD